MGLRSEAVTDLQEIYEDSTDGFGWSITVIDPADLSKPVVGRSNDIGQVVDLETGAVLSGRSVTVSFSIASLVAAGFTALPVGIADGSGKPWRVNFLDALGNAHTFKVQASHPDRGVGAVTCILEVYTP